MVVLPHLHSRQADFLSQLLGLPRIKSLPNGKIAPLPDWGSKDLKLGALRAVIRQLELDWKEFTDAK